MHFVIFTLLSLFFSNFITINTSLLFFMCVYLFSSDFVFKSFFIKSLIITPTYFINFNFKNFKNLFINLNFKNLFFLYVRFPFFKLKWQPLFKKSSYYGFYRSMRNQFLNK